ncbi:MAG: L-threonylcarbamoyladenylate synthase [Xanthomonadales bacterium]|nr:L-threonylcarbamoyladenylate synthase [Xanthomonadales bacterium]
MVSPPIVQGDESIELALAALADGLLVGLPTETVYGLAADASNPAAVARIFAAKGRPSFNPLIAHVAGVSEGAAEGQMDHRALALAEAFWPGPLTLVVPVNPAGVTCELARAGLSTIGLRVPAHPLARELISAHGGPLAAPSANPSGKLSPTSAHDVAEAFGQEVALVINGGPSSAGIESAIVAVVGDDQPRLLRPGAIARAELEALVGPLGARQSGSIDAPGQLSSHYAPRAALRLNASSRRPGEVLLGFGPGKEADLNLSVNSDTVEAAANLYRMLRELDSMGADTIAVMPIPEYGLGEAINDRLRRAAAPRNPEPTE